MRAKIIYQALAIACCLLLPAAGASDSPEYRSCEQYADNSKNVWRFVDAGDVSLPDYVFLDDVFNGLHIPSLHVASKDIQFGERKIIPIRALLKDSDTICLNAFASDDDRNILRQRMSQFFNLPDNFHALIAEKDRVVNGELSINDFLKNWQDELLHNNNTHADVIDAVFTDLLFHFKLQIKAQAALALYSFIESNIPNQKLINTALLNLIDLAVYDQNSHDASAFLAILAKQKSKLRIDESFHFHRLSAINYLNQAQATKAKPHLTAMQKLIDQNEILSSDQANFWDISGHYHITLARLSPAEHETIMKQALEQEYNALALAWDVKHHKTLVRIHSNIGWVLRSLNRMTDAISHYLLALIYLDKYPNAINSLLVNKNLAQVYSDLGQINYASAFFNASMDGTPDTLLWGKRIICELSITLVKSDVSDKSKQRFFQCMDNLSNDFEYMANHANFNDYLSLLIDSAFIGLKDKEAVLDELLARINKNDQVPLSQQVVAKKSLLEAIIYDELKSTDSYMERAINAAKATEVLALDAEILMHVLNHCLAQKTNRCDSTSVTEFAGMLIDSVGSLLSDVNQKDINIHFLKQFESVLGLIIDYSAARQDIDTLLNISSFATAFRDAKDQITQRLSPVDKDLAFALLSDSSQKSLINEKESTWQATFERLRAEANINLLEHGNDPWSYTKTMLDEYGTERLLNGRNSTVIASRPLQVTPGASLLLYFSGVEYMYLLHKFDDETALYTLGQTATIINQIAAIKNAALNRNTPVDLRRLDALKSTLVPTTLTSQLQQRIFILPDKNLFTFPFALFSTEHQSDHTWIVLQPTAQTTRDISPYNVSLTAFARPITDNVSNDWREGMPDLPWSQVEVDNIVKTFDGENVKTFMGEDATRGNLFGDFATDAEILHIATHAYFNPAKPDILGFTLTPEMTKGDPGFVTQFDLKNIQFNNKLVVINGCESGLGVSSNNLNSSIATEFLDAGAIQSIGTIWPVSDRASAIFMGAFYTSLIENKLPSVALKEAQRIMQKHRRYSHPYYWAGFTLYSGTTSLNAMSF